MVVVVELFEGRTEVFDSTGNRAEIPFLVSEAYDEAEVKAAAQVQIPGVYAGIARRSIEITERINEDSWKVVATFGDESAGSAVPTQESWVSFDTTGGTQHITQSIQTVSRYGPGASALLGGAIGYDGESIQGVDIAVPIYSFTETHILQGFVVTSGYRRRVFELTGKVNSDGYKGFLPGEVLFLGASGARRGTEDWEVTFRFAALPNRTDIRVGDISGIAKKGWEYLWVQYADEVDDAVLQVVKRPIAVYIEQVYETANFGPLGIGR